jgi:PAS domain-containing protein
MDTGSILWALGGCLLGLAAAASIGHGLLRRAALRSEAANAKLSRGSQELAGKCDRLEDAIDGLRLAMWDLDMRTGEVNLSTNWFALMGGVPRESPVPIADLIDLVPDGEQVDCWAAVRAVLRGASSSYDVEHRVRRDDGSFLWIRSRGAVSERSAEGRVMRMAGTNLDITARKTAEAAMKESEARLAHVADHLPMTVMILDADLGVIFANRLAHPEAQSLARLRRDELCAGAIVTCVDTRGELLRFVPRLDEDGLVSVAVFGEPHGDSMAPSHAGESLGAAPDSIN